MSPLNVEDTPYESKDDPTTIKQALIEPVGIIEQPPVPTIDKEKLFFQTKRLVGLMLFNTLLCSICLILGIEDVGGWLGFLVILIGTIFTGISGAWGYYKWGTVSEDIFKINGFNASLESEGIKLKTDKNKVERQVNKLRGRIKVLHSDLHELEERLIHFNQLKTKLEELDTDVDDIKIVVKTTANLIDELKSIAIENERAYLFELYYNIEFRDNQSGLNKDEYMRLLARLTKESRDMLTNNKTFEDIAGDDNIISLTEFQELVGDYLQRLDNVVFTRRETLSMLEEDDN